MRLELEVELRAAIAAGASARDAIAGLVARGAIGSPKQGLRTLEKWERRGEWECGVALDLGWFVAPKESA